MVVAKEKKGLLDAPRPDPMQDQGNDDGVDDEGGITDGTGRRPGDLWAQDLAGKGQAALDLAITNGMGRASVESAAGRQGARLRWYENYKRNYKACKTGVGKTTEELCRERGLMFVPLIIEAHGGGFGYALREVLGIIAEGVASRWNRRPDAVARRTAQRISFLTHSENAQAVLERLNADLVTGVEIPLVL